MNFKSLYVRAGDLVLPAWNKLQETLGSFRILKGAGVTLRRTTGGVIISATGSLAEFIGSFHASISGDSCKVGEGYINGNEPLIGKVPITGTDDKPQPSLKLREDRFDETGRSWICVVGKINPETGRIITPVNGKGTLELQIEQRDNPGPDPDDLLAVVPIAMLKRAGKEKTGLGTLHQIALFDYQHRSAKQNERWRHFFDPA